MAFLIPLDSQVNQACSRSSKTVGRIELLLSRRICIVSGLSHTPEEHILTNHDKICILYHYMTHSLSLYDTSQKESNLLDPFFMKNKYNKANMLC